MPLISLFTLTQCTLNSCGCRPAFEVVDDHTVELGLYLCLEVGFDLVDLGELGEGPAAIASVVVHAGYPVLGYRRRLLPGVLAAVAFDLDHQVRRSFPPVVHLCDEVGCAPARLEAVEIRDLQAQVVALSDQPNAPRTRAPGL